MVAHARLQSNRIQIYVCNVYAMRRDYFISPRIPFWPPGTYTAKELMEAIRKTANSSSRGHKNVQPGLNDTREPYVVTEEDKGRHS